MGRRVMSHQAGLLTTLHHIHICFPEQGGNMVTTMGWGLSDFRHLFCFTVLINKACMYHNHIPLMYIFDSPANECWVSFSFNNWRVGMTVTDSLVLADLQPPWWRWPVGSSQDLMQGWPNASTGSEGWPSVFGILLHKQRYVSWLTANKHE